MELILPQSLWWLCLIVVLVAGWRYSLVDTPVWKRVGSFSCRILAVILLTLAMCRPFSTTSSQEMHLVFLVDLSQSIDIESCTDALDDIQSTIDSLPTGDSWALFAMGSKTREFESTETMRRWIDSWKTEGADDSFRAESRIAESLLTTRLSFPAGKFKRVILFSDGQETEGFLGDALQQLGQENVDVRFARLEQLAETEAAVVSLKPSSARAYFGEVVRMNVVLTSNEPIRGNLRMIHKGVAIQEQPAQIAPDQPNRFHFDIDMVTPGESKWTAELIPEKDHFPINNQCTCTIAVLGKPRILILHEQTSEMRLFERAMAKQDVSVEVRGKFGMPETLEGMLAFDAMVLSDFPATHMSPRQMGLVQRYVRDFGGGLAMFGSENSFGLGGYHRTPVEEVLPLISRFEKEKEKPSLAMVLVIDKSGSMSGAPMALARQASRSAVELLGHRDQIAVIGFDSEPYVVSEMQSAGNKDSIAAEIDSMQGDGGTNMYPAMLVGNEMLENAPAKIRHMICLSDGHTQDADHESLVQAMVSSGITVSTVALGEADRQLMNTIAEIGRGRYYETNDPANVPQIFTKETIQATKSAIKEDLFGTVQTGDHRALAGFTGADLPFSLGYVMSQQKPASQLLLVAETGDPLLAISRFGLGTSLAFTSDLTERWGGEWLAWGDFGKFWGQIFRTIARKNESQGIHVTQQIVRDEWQLDIKRTDSAGRPQSKVQWEISTLDEYGRTRQARVREVGLGRYRSKVSIKDMDNLTLRLRDPVSNKTQVLHYDRPYPVEYGLFRKLPADIQKLNSISATNVRDNVVAQSSRRSVVHWFYFSALALLFLGNLIRRF